jgi:hypothetical protein
MCNGSGQHWHKPECIHGTGLFLAYVSYKATVDGTPHDAVRKRSESVWSWVLDAGIQHGGDPDEIEILRAPWNTISEEDRARWSWMAEGLPVFSWVMGRTELPAFFEICKPGPTGDALGMFHPGMADVIGTIPLRDASEVQVACLTHHMLLWRLQEQFKKPGRIDFEARVKDSTGKHLVVDGLDFRNSDLAIEGKFLDELPVARLSTIYAIVHERYKALRWALGFDASISANPVPPRPN